MARERTPAAFVYFVQGETTQRIKVGIASNMMTRLKALQTGSPDRLTVLGIIRCEDPRSRELYVQAKFRRSRHIGEWFSESAPLLAYIAAHAITLEQDEANRRAVFLERFRVQSQAVAPLIKGNNRQAKLARYKMSRGLV